MAKTKTPETKGNAIAPGAAACLGRRFPLRLEFVLKDSATAAGEEPFVVLSDEGERARVYLGRIVAGDETVVRHVAIKTQPRRGEPSGMEGQALTNRQRMARWEREWQHYLGMRDAGVGATPVYFVQGGTARAGEQPMPIQWPPLLYSPETRRLLRPRDGRGVALEVCRDDAVLAAKGLPASDGEVLFLYDAESKGAEGGFYQVPVKGQAQLPQAEDFDALLDAMARVAASPATVIDATTAQGIERMIDLAGDLPALRTTEGLPAQIEPWRLEGVQALVLELNELHFDEFSDILGGIDEKTFTARYVGPSSAIGQRMRLARTPFTQLRERPLLFSNDASGLDALEIFRLKWSLFAQTCQALLHYHRRCGAPHLRLSPRHVMVNIEPGGNYLPAMWRFQTNLISLGSPTLDLPGLEPGTEIYVPPVGSDPLYESELVRNSSFGVAQRGDFLLTAIEGEGDKQVIIFQMHHDGLGLRWLSLKDHVTVSLGHHLVAEAQIEMIAKRDPKHDYSRRTLYLRTLPMKLDKEKRAAVEKLRGIRVPNAQFRLLPSLHVPCDFHSLGMLLFRALVVNDSCSIGDVAVALDGLAQDLASLAVIECEPGQEAYYWETLLSGHRDQAVRGLFARSMVFYSEFERTKERPNAIPKHLWNEALAMGLQLVTNFENFSFCAKHGDYAETAPAAKIEPLVRKIEELGRKIDAALFALTARNAEVRQALELVMQEVAKA